MTLRYAAAGAAAVSTTKSTAIFSANEIQEAGATACSGELRSMFSSQVLDAYGKHSDIPEDTNHLSQAVEEIQSHTCLRRCPSCRDFVAESSRAGE
jgi:hypothetical protein